MAIAITLLILDVRPPATAPGHSLAAALLRQWPAYAAYVVSFLMIGIIWMNHHQMFKMIVRTTPQFLMLNVIFLLTIAFLPFPTALVAEHLRDPASRSTAAFTYGACMVAIAVMFNVVWIYAAKGRRLLSDEVDEAMLARTRRSYMLGPVVYGVGALLALVNAYVSLAIFAALALYYSLPGSGPGR
jgi:uncharacterized membrane protein